MKIALLYDMIYPYSIGGVEVRNYTLAKMLTKRGHEVHLYGIKLWKGKNLIKKEGIYIHGIASLKKKYNFRGKRKIFEPIWFAFKLINLLKEKFDIIDCCAFPYFPCFTAKGYSFIKRVPMVLTWHEVWDNYWNFYLKGIGFIGKIIERFTTKLSSYHITVSKTTRNALIQLGVKEKNIFIIPNWIDFENIKRAKPTNQEFDVIYAGRLMQHKHVDILIRSLHLLKSIKPDIKAIIIGCGPEKRYIINLINNLKLNKNIKLLNWVSHNKLYAYMKSSKVFVLPSTLEGFGITALEALSCGIPVITINHEKNAVRELIKNKKNGIICRLSIKEIAFNIYTLITSNKKIAFNPEKYDINRIIPKIEKLYLNLI